MCPFGTGNNFSSIELSGATRSGHFAHARIRRSGNTRGVPSPCKGRAIAFERHSNGRLGRLPPHGTGRARVPHGVAQVGQARLAVGEGGGGLGRGVASVQRRCVSSLDPHPQPLRTRALVFTHLHRAARQKSESFQCWTRLSSRLRNHRRTDSVDQLVIRGRHSCPALNTGWGGLATVACKKGGQLARGTG
jgi:hypothetical protein